MNWGSASNFLAMGGYAPYVWGSFGLCALVMLAEPLLLAWRRREVIARLRRQALADRLDAEAST